MRQVIVTEFAKLRRSAVPWVTLGGLMCGPLALALFIWIVRDPDRAASLGLLGTKANLSGLEASWTAYGSYLSIVIGAGGMILVAFIVAFLFGREYADGTAKNMLALPVPREWFVVGKLVVAAVWWLAIAVIVLAEGFAIGAAMDLPGFSGELAAGTVRGTLLAAFVSFLLVPVVAWITVWTRNYLASLGFALGMLVLGDVIGHTGWAPWFPWSIVPSLTGLTGQSTPSLPWGSYVVLALTFVVGVVGASWRLRYADNP